MRQSLPIRPLLAAFLLSGLFSNQLEASKMAEAEPAKKFETVSLELRPLLLREINGLVNQVHFGQRSNPRIEIGNTEAFTQPARDNPRAAARAEAAHFVLTHLAYPERIERSAESMKSQGYHHLADNIKEKAGELRERASSNDSTKEALAYIQKKYAAPGPDLDDIAKKLEALYSGWVERWSEPYRVDTDWGSRWARDYVLEKPEAKDAAPLKRRLLVPEYRPKDEAFDPIDSEHSGLWSSASRLHYSLAPSERERDGCLPIWNFISAVLLVFGGMGSLCIDFKLHWWIGAGFYLSSPFIGAWFARRFADNIHDLGYGIGAKSRLSTPEAIDELLKEKKRLASFEDAACALALTIGVLTGFALFFGGTLGNAFAQFPAGWTPLQEHAETLVTLACIAGTLLAGGLFGWALSLEWCQDLADMTLEMLRLKGVERGGGI